MLGNKKEMEKECFGFKIAVFQPPLFGDRGSDSVGCLVKQLSDQFEEFVFLRVVGRTVRQLELEMRLYDSSCEVLSFSFLSSDQSLHPTTLSAWPALPHSAPYRRHQCKSGERMAQVNCHHGQNALCGHSHLLDSRNHICIFLPR